MAAYIDAMRRLHTRWLKADKPRLIEERVIRVQEPRDVQPKQSVQEILSAGLAAMMGGGGERSGI